MDLGYLEQETHLKTKQLPYTLINTRSPEKFLYLQGRVWSVLTLLCKTVYEHFLSNYFKCCTETIQSIILACFCKVKK